MIISENGNEVKRKEEELVGITLPHEAGISWPVMPSSHFSSAVDEVSKRYQAYYPMVIQSALGALSVACQNRYVVARPHDQGVHPISLNLLTIAESGERKSTIEDIFFAPIRDKEYELMEAYRQEKVSFSNEYDIWNNKYKALNRKLSKEVEKGEKTTETENLIRRIQKEKPTIPLKPSFIFEDTSRAALFQSMRDGLPMALLLSSEADHVLNGMAFQENSAMNSLWSGSDVKINRSTTEDIQLRNCRLTVALQTQPSAFEIFMTKRGSRAHGTGLLARFLTVRALEHREPRKFSFSKQVFQTKIFHQKVESLLDEGIQFARSGSTDYKVLELSHEASNAWIALSNNIEYEQMPGRRLANAKDFASKMMENISRIAALVHLCNRAKNDDLEIDRKTFQFAADLCLHYADTFKNEFVPTPKIIEKAQKAFLKLSEIYGDYLESDNVEFFDSDLYKKGVIRNPADKDEIYDLLEEWGVISWGKRKRKWFFHPNDYKGSLMDAYRQQEKKDWDKPYRPRTQQGSLV